MVIKAIHPPYPYDYDHLYDCFEPRQVQTYSIFELLVPVTPISEHGTELPYHESYHFWVNPENTITLEDIADLYQYQLGEDFKYTTRSEELSEKWYTPSTESQDTGFSILSVWGNQR